MNETDDKTRPWMRHAPVLVIALAAMIGAGFLFALYVPITINYSLQATFDSMPQDDVDLLKWLASQHGVVRQSVHIERPAGTKVVKAHFRMTRPLLGEPWIPDWPTDMGYTMAAEVYP